MAETAITPTQLTSDTAVVITAGTGTAINTSNYMTMAYPKDGQLLIKIQSTNDATSGVLTAGFGVDAQTETYAATNGVTSLFVVGSSAKVKNSDGEIRIDWATSSAGYLQAFYLPTSNQ